MSSDALPSSREKAAKEYFERRYAELTGVKALETSIELYPDCAQFLHAHAADYLASSPSIAAEPDGNGPSDQAGSSVRLDSELIPGGRHTSSLHSAPGRASPSAPSGDRFEIREEHKKGGMGTVFKAYDQECDRIVALKKIQDKFADDEKWQQEFEKEASVTSKLEHPGIVPVYGAGKLGDGRHFYAMRFVEGPTFAETVSEFHKAAPKTMGDREKQTLAFRGLLQKFINVCETVEYAHHRGVFHLDLKPVNILMGAFGETLVLDWGVSRTMEREPIQSTDIAIPKMPSAEDCEVALSQEVGTEAYMAPEQKQKGGRVSTKTDVYGLGGILYVLLVGEAPNNGNRDEELKKTTRRASERFGVSRRALRPLIAIVEKALQSEPQYRYASANKLAKDIQNYLADQCVSAHPDSWQEWLSRFSRRRFALMQSAVSALAVVSLVLLTAAIAINHQRNVAVAAKGESDKAKARAERVLDVLVTSFRRPDPAIDGRDVKVVSVLGQALGEVDKLADSPEDQTALLDALALTYRGLGLYDESLEIVKRLAKAADGREHGEADLALLGRLGVAYLDADQPDKTVQLLRNVVEQQRAKLGEDHPDTILSMNNLAMAYQAAGQLNDALPLMKRVLEVTRTRHGKDEPETLTSMNNLAVVFQSAGQMDAALPLLIRVEELTRARFGGDHPDTLMSMNNLACGYRAAGEMDKALPMLVQTLELMHSKLGPDHPDTLTTMGNLADGYRAAGRIDKALPLLETALELQRAKLPPDHTATLMSMGRLGLGYLAAGETNKALPILEDTLDGMRVKLGPDHPNTLTAMGNLVDGYRAAGQTSKALPLLESVLELRRAKFEPGHPDTLASMGNLAGCYQEIGEVDKAVTLFEESLALRRDKFGDAHPGILTAMNNLAVAYLEAGKINETLPLLEKTLDLVSTKLGDDHPNTLISMRNLAAAYLDAGDIERSIPLLDKTLPLMVGKLGDSHPNTLRVMGTLAKGYWLAGRTDKAIPLFEKTVELMRAKLGDDHPHTLISMTNLAAAHLDAGEVDKAIPLFERTLEGLRIKLGELHPNTLKTLRYFACALIQSGRTDRGQLEESLKYERDRLPKSDPRLGNTLIDVGRSLVEAKQFAIAEGYLREAVEIFEARKIDNWRYAQAQCLLGSALAGQGKREAAEPLLTEGYQGMKGHERSLPRPLPKDMLSAASQLVDFYTTAGKASKVAEYKVELDRVNVRVEALRNFASSLQADNMSP